MASFGLFDAKNRFSELVTRALAGEEVVVTRHGRPVARVVAYEDHAGAKAREKAQQESLARLAGLRGAAGRRMSAAEIAAARRER